MPFTVAKISRESGDSSGEGQSLVLVQMAAKRYPRVENQKNSLCSSGVIGPLTASASVRGLRLRTSLVGRIVCAGFVLFRFLFACWVSFSHAVYKDFI
jgi:hypothetical protein